MRVALSFATLLLAPLVFGAAIGEDCFADWPEGKDPATVSRRLTDLFLSTSPDRYKPQGFVSPECYADKDGYGGGRHIHYSVASLWINAMECARLLGDKGREQQLVDAFEPYYGDKEWMLPKFKHVDFTIVGSVPLEIAILNGDARAKALGLKYADMQWEKPKADDPPPPYDKNSIEERMKWWNQGYTCQTRLWIDDMYMITVLQSQAYRLTKEQKYIDRAAKEMALYLDNIQVKDGKDAGLFYHAPDVPFVWGRGAGWMAAGMSLLLQYLPESSPYHAKIKACYQKMMAALLKRQNENGTWNQLVGDRSTWEETSCTAMYGYAFAMGVKHGWLCPKKYAPAARKAYLAVVGRLDRYGNVPDVCCGTGKCNDYAWYRDRPHVHGDPHGQAPLMWMCRTFLDK